MSNIDFNCNNVIDVFHEVVQMYPERIAIRAKDRQYTYREIDAISSKIAIKLQMLGYKKNTVIGLYMDRNAEYLISVIGILKSGCSFLPLSTQYPKERINTILRISQANGVITDSAYDFNSNIECLYYSNLAHHDMEIELNAVEVSNEDVAYIIFTSGSTGEPKGIRIPHRAILNLVHSLSDYLLPKKNWKPQKVTVLAEFVFDMSIGQIFYSLLTGQNLCIVFNEVKENIISLVDFIEQEEIDVLDITPLHLKAIVDFYKLSNQKMHAPSFILSSGEALPLSIAEGVFALEMFQNSVLLNCYGPAEACVYVTILPISYDKIRKLDKMSVGTPIRNTRIYILDENMNQCESNIVGEIYINSVNVGKGYINREDLTKSVFLEDMNHHPYGMYRTGDLGYWGDNGELYYVGRKDHQVKISGYRIELEEIQYQMNQLPKVNQVCLVVKENDNDKFIVAYYQSQEELSISYFEEELSKVLPHYMLPKYYVPVDEFVRTLNGKLDTKHVPDYKKYCLRKEVFNRKVSILSNEILSKLLDICNSLFERKSVEQYDNFYAIGGNSILALALNIQIYKEWNISLTLSEVLKCNCMIELSNLIYTKVQQMKPLSKQDRQNKVDYATLRFFQDMIIRQERRANRKRDKLHLNPYPTYNVLHLIQVEETLEYERLADAIHDVVAEDKVFEIAVRRGENSRLEMFYDIPNDIHLQCIKCDDISDYDYMKCCANDFNVNKLPLIEFILFEDKNSKQALLINAHHIIYDYYSSFVLLDRIFSKYDGSKINVQKSDFLNYVDMLNHADRTEDIQFYLDYYKNYPMSKFLPGDKKDGDIRLDNLLFQEIEFCIEGKLFLEIQSISRELKITPYIFTFGCFFLFLSICLQQDDIIVGTYCNCRKVDAFDTLHMIGLITNMIGIRSDINKDDKFHSFLCHLQENILNVLDHQTLEDFELYGLFDEEYIGRGKLYQIVYNYVVEGQVKLQQSKRKIQMEEIGEETESIPFYIKGYETQEKIKFKIKYCTEVYSTSCIQQYMKMFVHLIEIATRNRNITIGEMITQLLTD